MNESRPPSSEPVGITGPRDGEFADWHRPLTLSSSPDSDASWSPDITEFALTFDGYAAFGGQVGDLANATLEKWEQTRELPRNLIALRACLFFEQRRYRHFGHEPGEDAMPYIRALIKAIRLQVVETLENPS